MKRSKIIILIIGALVVLSLCAALFFLVFATGEGSSLKGAVVYDSRSDDETWADTYSYLDQSLVLDFQGETLDVAGDFSLEDYDVLYLTTSLKDNWNQGSLEQDLVTYVENGGNLIIPNDFYNLFQPEFIGADEFVPVEGCPVELNFPDVGEDLQEIQEIIEDFSGLYKEYDDFSRLSALDYGWGFRPSTATSLVTMGDITLYSVNSYGSGKVFFTNPLLPNSYAVSGFDLVSPGEDQEYLSTTTASANQLLVNAYIGYVAKSRDGYVATRVFGSYGQPGMAWELHYEELGAFANDAAGQFSELCEEAEQIPSFTLIRNSYTWFLRGETVTYLLNQGDNSTPSFAMDYYEGAYSCGTHAVAGDKWLSLAEIEDGGSYFSDNPDYTIRAYPCFSTVDTQGLANLYCGSADGKIYYYQNSNYENSWTMSEGETLKNPLDEELTTAGYSAPAACDIDGDGVEDILVGTNEGTLVLFRGEGDNTFTNQGTWLRPFTNGQALPAIGDINGDGCGDLAVGSDIGTLLVWYGTSQDSLEIDQANPTDLTGLCGEAQLGSWLAPGIGDLNGDGTMDLALGTYHGYVAQVISNGSDFTFEGYITLEEMNYKANNNAKFGNYAVPRFGDLNGDGNTDIIVGHQEYGLAYPIDSEYFPYKEELQDQIDTMKEKNYYLGVHFYTNRYASSQREQWELQAHKDAMSAYGVEVDGVGVNQHTWWTSTLGDTQTFDNIAAEGFKWNSGFTPPGSEVLPQVAAENTLSLPFFYANDDGDDLLIQNVATIPEGPDQWRPLMAKYNMPVCVYYHCDLIYKSSKGAIETIEEVQDFRDTYNYSFVREDQLMLASAAAYNLTLEVEREKDGSLKLTPGEKEQRGSLYNQNYSNACGVKISFAESENPDDYSVDADIWRRVDNDIYIGLNREVNLVKNGEPETNHITAVNIPCDITTEETGATIEFLDSGLLEVTVAGTAVTDDKTWSVTQREDTTIFRKFGSEDTLNITYK